MTIKKELPCPRTSSEIAACIAYLFQRPSVLCASDDSAPCALSARAHHTLLMDTNAAYEHAYSFQPESIVGDP